MWKVAFVFLGVAVPSVMLYECQVDRDCQIEGAVCVNSTCACPPDHITNSVATKCLAIAHGLGASCTDNLQCSSSLQSGGFCNNGTCSCEPGYHYFVGNCWQTAGLFEQCYSDENCFVDHDFESSVCNSNKTCVCRDGYYQREYSSCRKSSYEPGQPCGISLDCKFSNATCLWNRTCALANQSSSVMIGSDYHGSNANTYVAKHRSSKKEGSLVHMSTFAQRAAGGTCNKSSDCPHFAECLASGVCLCLPGYYSIDDNTCYPEVGANCTVDVGCVGKNTVCSSKNICVCQEGFVISEDRRFCDKLSRFIGWSCLTDTWCAYFGPNAVCKDLKCACSNTTHYVTDQMYCWVTKKAGESCSSQLDCGIGGMSCSSDFCTCQSKTHPSSNRETCRPDALRPGDKCVEALDCMYPNAACNATSGVCICAENYILNSTGACVPGVGGSCNQTVCSMEHSHCNDTSKFCECDVDFVSNAAHSMCLPIQAQIGGSCLDSAQCARLDAHCSQGKCTCYPKHHFVKDWRCFKDSQLGEHCSRNGECVVEHSSCIKYVCSCDHGYRTEGNICSGSSKNASFVALQWIGALISGYSLRYHITSA